MSLSYMWPFGGSGFSLLACWHFAGASMSLHILTIRALPDHWMPRSDLTAQRSLPFLNALDFVRPGIPDKQRNARILYNQIVRRIQLAPRDDLALVVIWLLKIFNFVFHGASFGNARPGHGTNPGGSRLRSVPPSDNTRRGSHSGLGPWRAGPDSNRQSPGVRRACFLKHFLPIGAPLPHHRQGRYEVDPGERN